MVDVVINLDVFINLGVQSGGSACLSHTRDAQFGPTVVGGQHHTSVLSPEINAVKIIHRSKGCDCLVI